MRERRIAELRTIAVLAARIYSKNDAENPEGRTPQQCRRDAVAGVTHVIEGLVDDVQSARPIALAAVAIAYSSRDAEQEKESPSWS